MCDFVGDGRSVVTILQQIDDGQASVRLYIKRKAGELRYYLSMKTPDSFRSVEVSEGYAGGFQQKRKLTVSLAGRILDFAKSVGSPRYYQC